MAGTNPPYVDRLDVARRRCRGFGVLLLSVSCVAASRLGAQAPSPAPERPAEPRGTRLVLLGTGTPNADPDRSGPAVAVVVEDTAYLVDCGPGVVRRAAAAHRNGIAALDPAKLGHLFVTHLHSDHTAGYADLILTPWVHGRDQPLMVYGPEGIKKMTAHLLEAYDEDIRMRTSGIQPSNREGYKVDVHEIEPGLVYKDDKVSVTAFAVTHGTWAHAFGFRFQSADRSIVISGDTAPSRNLVEHARGCDVLVHEVYSQVAFEKRSPDWQRYHGVFHTSTVNLARIAQQVQPGLLVLYHQLFWGRTDEELVDEIRSTYTGRVVSGRDLEVY